MVVIQEVDAFLRVPSKSFDELSQNLTQLTKVRLMNFFTVIYILSHLRVGNVNESSYSLHVS